VEPIPPALEATIRTRLRERLTQGLALACFDARGIRFAGGVGHADAITGLQLVPLRGPRTDPWLGRGRRG